MASLNDTALLLLLFLHNRTLQLHLLWHLLLVLLLLLLLLLCRLLLLLRHRHGERLLLLGRWRCC